MKICTIYFSGALFALSQPAFAATDVCTQAWDGTLMHYLTVTSSEASDPEIEAYRLWTDAYDSFGSWIAGAQRIWAVSGAGMQQGYHWLHWSIPGDRIVGWPSHMLTDYDGEMYPEEFENYFEHVLWEVGDGCEKWWPDA